MVVCGVALVSVREINFSPFSLGFGMVSNCAFALYSIVAKLLLNTRDAESTYACLAALSCLVLSPVALVMEWSGAGASKVAAANSAIDQASTGHTGWHLVLLLLGTGIMQYVSNLIAFDTLSMIHPISYAMANTFKRSVVVGASLVFFKQRLPPAGALGAALALVGALGYSLAIDRDLRARAKLQERLMAVKARHGDKSLPPELAERLQIQHPRLVATPAAAVAISGKQSAAGSA
jgi:drug/metabolite transporter (DMT)-like permease